MIDSEDVACAFRARLSFEKPDRPVLRPSFELTKQSSHMSTTRPDCRPAMGHWRIPSHFRELKKVDNKIKTLEESKHKELKVKKSCIVHIGQTQ